MLYLKYNVNNLFTYMDEQFQFRGRTLYEISFVSDLAPHNKGDNNLPLVRRLEFTGTDLK